jgi:hypothetical protein
LVHEKILGRQDVGIAKLLQIVTRPSADQTNAKAGDRQRSHGWRLPQRRLLKQVSVAEYSSRAASPVRGSAESIASQGAGTFEPNHRLGIMSSDVFWAMDYAVQSGRIPR